MRKPIQIAVCAVLLAGLRDVVGLPLYAAEHVTLSNGFAMDCDHHALVDGQMRLYLSAGESNFIVLKPEEVTEVEAVPDLPAASAAPVATVPTAKEGTTLSPVDLHEMLADAGQAHNLDVDLLASVVKAESDGNAHAVSRAGAQGLMQLMPSTATDLGVRNGFEPTENVRGGAVYLDALLTRYHENLGLALAAYNAGPAAVDKYHEIPPYHETRAYVARVIHEFNRRVLEREARAKQVTARTPTTE
jgi:soluble lytic murein transglycosylase-like protein